MRVKRQLPAVAVGLNMCEDIMALEIDRVEGGAAASFQSPYDITAAKLGMSPVDKVLPSASLIDEYAALRKAEMQKRLFGSRYIDVLVGPETKKPSILGTTTEKSQKLVQGPFVDVLVPYSQPFDAEKYSVTKSSEVLKIAREEQPKAPIPVEAKLEVKAPSPTDRPILESPKMTSKAAKKSVGIFHRFIDWVSGLFKKKDKNKVDDDDEMKGKLESPAERNAVAIRDCLKKLNESLTKMRDLVQNDTVSSSSADLESAMMFMLLISAIRRYDETKKKDIAMSHKEMMEAQKAFKAAQKKYLEALNGTLLLPKLSKWILTPIEYASTATMIAAFGLAGAAVIAGLATGGIGAVVGAVASISMYFIVMQSLAFIGKGSVKIIEAVAKYKQDRHKGNMIESRFIQDEATFAIQEEMRRILDSTIEVSKAWENLSGVMEQKIATISMLKS